MFTNLKDEGKWKSLTHPDQGYSVTIRTWYRNIDQGFSDSGSLAFFGSTVRAMKSIVRAEALVLCVDVLALLTWLVLATSTSQVNMVGVEARRKKRY